MSGVLVIMVQATDTRFLSYGQTCEALVVQQRQLLAAILKFHGLQATDAPAVIKSKLHNDKAYRAYVLVSDKQVRIHLWISAELSFGVITPLIKKATSFMSLRFDCLATMVTFLLDVVVSVRADPTGSGFFDNTLAYAAYHGFDVPSVKALIVQYVTAFGNYTLDRLDYVNRLPWAWSYLYHPTLRQQFAIALLAKFNDPASAELVRRAEPVGAQRKAELIDALKLVARGGEPNDVLKRAVALTFGAWAISQSLNELDVKVLKAILADGYTAMESIIARYILFNTNQDWFSRIVELFGKNATAEGKEIVRQVKEEIRKAKASRKRDRSGEAEGVQSITKELTPETEAAIATAVAEGLAELRVEKGSNMAATSG